MENLLVILSLIQRANGMRLLRQLLPNVIMVAGLLCVIAIMVSALLLGGLFAAYVILVENGVSAHMSMIYVAISTIIMIVILGFITNAYILKMRQMPKTLLAQSPASFRVMDMLNAFIDGFLTR
jgi:hypothetical protein